jgi:haloalkane dehalogenase
MPDADIAAPQRDLYPFTGRYWELEGLRYHYLDEGQGDPVVMLHGNPTWSFYYRELVAGLRDHFRIVVPDHIGCGFSDKPDDSRYEYTLRRRVLDLEALLEHLEIRDNLTLVLHDWGGMIGMTYATWHPERVKRLILLNTAAFHLPSNKRLPWSLGLCRNRLAGPLLVQGLNAFCRGAASYCSCRGLSASVRKQYLAPYDSWGHRLAVLRFVQDIPVRPGDHSYDLVTQVERSLDRFAALPILICWGERDFVFDRDYLAQWQHRFPQAEVHRFADAGHYVLEDAGTEILPLVRDFLKRHPLPQNGEWGMGNGE